MKVSIDIDCTPDEARRFLGLPDVAPIQEAMMAELQKRMSAGLDQMDPETIMRNWFPGGFAGMENIQKMFWDQFSGMAGGDAGKDKKD